MKKKRKNPAAGAPFFTSRFRQDGTKGLSRKAGANQVMVGLLVQGQPGSRARDN